MHLSYFASFTGSANDLPRGSLSNSSHNELSSGITLSSSLCFLESVFVSPLLPSRLFCLCLARFILSPRISSLMLSSLSWDSCGSWTSNFLLGSSFFFLVVSSERKSRRDASLLTGSCFVSFSPLFLENGLSVGVFLPSKLVGVFLPSKFVGVFLPV